jgi:hypothetical protein
MHGSHAGAAAQMGEDHPPFRGFRIEASEFFHQECIGQAVKTVSLDAFCRVPPGDRQQPGDG